jgi:hypothetical protein
MGHTGPAGTQGPKGDDGAPGQATLASFEGTACVRTDGSAGTVHVVQGNTIAMRQFGGSEDTAAIADTIQFVTTGSAPSPEPLVFRVYGTTAGTTGAYALTRI